MEDDAVDSSRLSSCIALANRSNATSNTTTAVAARTRILRLIVQNRVPQSSHR